MRNKKGIELSVNFLVITILSIAMLSFGIYFTTKVFTKSSELTVRIDEQTNSKIEDLFNDGSRVVVPYTTKTVRRGELGVFGIGILNTLGGNNKFKVLIQNKDGEEMIIPTAAFYYTTTGTLGGDETKVSILGNLDEQTIQNNDRIKVAIAAVVDPSAPSGTYVVDVNVTYHHAADDKWYTYGDSLRKLNVVVP